MIDWGSLLSRVLPRVDLFVPSIEELLYVLDRQEFARLAGNVGGEQIIRQVTFADLARLAERAQAHGVSAVLIKLGDRGAYLRTGPRGVGRAGGLGEP